MRKFLRSIAALIVLLLSFTTYAEDSISGVGLLIGPRKQKIVIYEVIPNSPANKAGITPGLIIMKVDDKSTEGMQWEDCVHLIRGPVGSKVKLELFDPGRNKSISFEITRDTINVN